jgi:hypothetical protein
VVIAPGKLTDFCPYQQPGSDSAVAMYDKDDVEQIGLVKFDLGLATLTILEIAREFIMKRHKGRRTSSSKKSRWTTTPPTSCSRTARPKPCSSLNPAACRACCATPSRRAWKT